MRISFLVGALVAFSLAASVGASASNEKEDSELVLLVSLTRHGSRAPNPSVKKHCPKNLPNIMAYHVPSEELTERGMRQLEETGKHIREIYVEEKHFLSPSFNGNEHPHFEAYFRADAANRCGQSAISLGYGLYPEGTGPKGFAKQPIPVYMQLWENEHDFTANAPCWSVMHKMNDQYVATRGKELMAKHSDALQEIAEICGNEFYHVDDPILAIKDVSDMLLFDIDEGLPPTKGLKPELTKELSTLAFQNLIERLYSTPRDITTTIGGFPTLLLRNLNDGAAPGRDPEKSTKYFSYHGHRELMHGLGFMMGMKFNFDGMPAYNGSTALHPGTTLFFELHRKKKSSDSVTPISNDDYFVQLYVWSPVTSRTAVKLDTCAMDCPLPEFSQIILRHIQSTGTWQDICNYHPVFRSSMMDLAAPINSPTAEKEQMTLRHEKGESMPVPVVSAQQEEEYQESILTTDNSDRVRGTYTMSFLFICGFVVAAALYIMTYQRILKRREYLSL